MMISKRILLRGGRIVTPETILEQAALLIENGRIARIYADGNDLPRTVDTFDLGGAYLLPGFIDLHVHGALGVDVNAADADDLQRVAGFLATQGVTAWLPTLVPGGDDEYARAARAVSELMHRQTATNETANVGARALGLHYEGPFVNAARCGALRTRFFRNFADGADNLAGIAEVDAPQAIHLTTLAPEIEGGIELIRELKRRSWIVSIGHTRAELDALDAACAAGASHITHFMNAMTGLHHRAPGVVGWGLLKDEMTCDVIADGVHLAPHALRLIARAKTTERVALISDAVAPAGLGDGEFTVWGEQISVRERKTTNARGSIAGSVITLLDAVRFMLNLGFGYAEVARMAATVPARILGLEQETGAICEGLRADLIALDDEKDIKLTLIGGKNSAVLNLGSSVLPHFWGRVVASD